MKEKIIVRQISKYLDSLPDTWYFKVWGGPFQIAGIPDLIGVQSGRFFALEVKTPDGRLSTLQRIILQKIRDAGGLCGVARSVQDAEVILRGEERQESVAESAIEELFWAEAEWRIPGLIPQYGIEPYTVDFCLPAAKIVIELDGKQYHDTPRGRERDAKKDRFLGELGWSVLRFSGAEIYEDTIKCVEKTIAFIKKSREKATP